MSKSGYCYGLFARPKPSGVGAFSARKTAAHQPGNSPSWFGPTKKNPPSRCRGDGINEPVMAFTGWYLQPAPRASKSSQLRMQ